MWIVRLRHAEVARRLAIEEGLLERAAERGPLLLIGAGRPAVVVGKNQCPWREFRVDRARRAGVAIARRISGGGTVYDDAGNLNVSLILPREAYDLDRQFGVWLRALASCGIPAERRGHALHLPDGGKISGHAFCLRRSAALHHATLLVDADLDALRRLLEPPGVPVRTRATPSRPSPVANLGPRGVSMERLERAVEAAAAACYGGGLHPLPERERQDAEDAAIVERHRSWSWVFGRSPETAVRWPWRPGAEIEATVRGGEVAEWRATAGAEDDTLNNALDALRRGTTGCRMDPAELGGRIRAAAQATAARAPRAALVRLAAAVESAWS